MKTCSLGDSNCSGNYCTPRLADTCGILLWLTFDDESVIIIYGCTSTCLVPHRNAAIPRFLHEIGHNWKLHHAGGPFASQDSAATSCDTVKCCSWFSFCASLFFPLSLVPVRLCVFFFSLISLFVGGCVGGCEQNMHPLVSASRLCTSWCYTHGRNHEGPWADILPLWKGQRELLHSIRHYCNIDWLLLVATWYRESSGDEKLSDNCAGIFWHEFCHGILLQHPLSPPLSLGSGGLWAGDHVPWYYVVRIRPDKNIYLAALVRLDFWWHIPVAGAPSKLNQKFILGA